MAEAFIGEIRIFGGNFAPRGWAMCNGQLLPIRQNTALFSLLGVNFGGNGITTFGLPNLQGAVPMHPSSSAPGLSSRTLGESGGSHSTQLLSSNMPQHSHPVVATTDSANTLAPGPTTRLAAATGGRGSRGPSMYSSTAAPTPLNPTSVGVTGSGLPFSITNPVQVVNYIICLQGIFPQRP